MHIATTETPSRFPGSPLPWPCHSAAQLFELRALAKRCAAALDRTGVGAVVLATPPAALIKAGLVERDGRTRKGVRYALTAEGAFWAANGDRTPEDRQEADAAICGRILEYVGHRPAPLFTA